MLLSCNKSSTKLGRVFVPQHARRFEQLLQLPLQSLSVPLCDWLCSYAWSQFSVKLRGH